MMTLSIVSHRQCAMVEQLLEDLAAIASPLVTAIIVTRNVEERTLRVPETLVPITSTIANAAPRGFGANHNEAFRRCATALFVVLNPDVRLSGDPFPAINARFDWPLADHCPASQVALVAPIIVTPDGVVEDALRTLITPWQLIRHRVLGHARHVASDFDWVAGMFLVVRSAAFRAVNGFDERYFMYCEDFDLCARFRLNGWSIVIADSVRVIHDAQRKSHRSIKHLAWHVSSLAKMWLSLTFWQYRDVLRKGPRR